MVKKSSAFTLEYILLGMIHEQPAHGYALFEQLKDTPELSLIWHVKRSKLYYLLEKLETDGFIQSSLESDGPYPDRKVYHLTSQGMEALQKWIYSPVPSSRYVRLAFLSKLYFVLQEGREKAVDLLNRQMEICQGWVNSLQKQHQALAENDFISSQVYLFRIGQIKAMLKWLENCQENLPEE
jgi:DNA-binding PadR family transcriptional regulator